MTNGLNEKIVDWMRRIMDRASQLTGIKDGKVIIVIGGRGNGKSELVKKFCRSLSGTKYILKVDENLNPTEISRDDKDDYKKIPGCRLIENKEDMESALNENGKNLSNKDEEDRSIDLPSGLTIFEDFPALSQEGEKAIYNIVKDCRHKKVNLIIIAHDYKVLKNSVFKHASAICIFKDAAINAPQLNTRLNDLSKAHAIIRAKSDLGNYQYIFVSFDDRKWHKDFLNNRDVEILRKFLRGKLSEKDLSDIDYPKKNSRYSPVRQKTKRRCIEEMIKENKMDLPSIAKAIGTSDAYVWKVKHYMKKEYLEKHGGHSLPPYLEDCRKKKSPQKRKESHH